MLGSMAAKHERPVLYVNQVGGNDDLVFDGRSSRVRRRRRARSRAAARSPRTSSSSIWIAPHAARARDPSAPREAEVWDALVLGTRDYVRKCGFSSVVLGLSGGVDSALTAAIAADAVGAGQVLGVLMPSPYSSQGSVDDSRRSRRSGSASRR